MANDPKTRKLRPGALPRGPGRPPSGEDGRDHRLMMRVNSSLVDLIDIRARERGESRSRFIEKLLIGFLRADPRNPKLDASGRILTDGPAISRAHEAVRFGAAWVKFAAVNDALFGLKIPDEWMEEAPGFVDEQRGGNIREDD